MGGIVICGKTGIQIGGGSSVCFISGNSSSDMISFVFFYRYGLARLNGFSYTFSYFNYNAFYFKCGGLFSCAANTFSQTVLADLGGCLLEATTYFYTFSWIIILCHKNLSQVASNFSVSITRRNSKIKGCSSCGRFLSDNCRIKTASSELLWFISYSLIASSYLDKCSKFLISFSSFEISVATDFCTLYWNFFRINIYELDSAFAFCIFFPNLVSANFLARWKLFVPLLAGSGVVLHIGLV